MKISKIKIENYRGIKNVNADLSKFSCIIGENNAGKSSILLALSLFFSGRNLTASEFYNPSSEIIIEIQYEDFQPRDLLRLTTEQAERIQEVIYQNKLILVRKYSTDGKNELLCKKLVPINEKFSDTFINDLLKGKKAREIVNSLNSEFPLYQDRFTNVTSQKGAKEILEEIANNLPNTEKKFDIGSLPTGIENSIKNLLHEPIFIEGVKDLKDEIKTKETATFGKLLSLLLKSIENSNQLENIVNSFSQLNGLLNRVKQQDGTIIDNRLDRLKSIELTIQSLLQENFPKVSIELEIPKPELKQIFSNAQIFINDGILGLIETKGDGLKRALTFSLLRSYVNLKKQIAEEELNAQNGNNVPIEQIAKPQPYLFLFEEPELYLYPSSQKILFDALVKLSNLDDQVIVTTHSPLFFSANSAGTFMKISKFYPIDTSEKPYGESKVVNLLSEISLKDAFQIICYENNAVGFFAKKILMVEGDSELIYVKEIAKLLNENWDFDKENIPIVSMKSKSNVKRYKNFFQNFDIEVHCLLDSDAVLDGFNLLDVPETIIQEHDTLIKVIDKFASENNVQPKIKSDKVKELLRRYTWVARYERLKEFADKIKTGIVLNDEEREEIEFLFYEEIIDTRRTVFKTSELVEKYNLLTNLRQNNIYILASGAIENYYPNNTTGNDKPSKALKAVEIVKNLDNIRAILPKFAIGMDKYCELELIFDNIFQTNFSNKIID